MKAYFARLEAFATKWIAWLQSKAPSWFVKNSWTNEGLVGFVGTLFCIWLLHWNLGGVILFNAANYYYENRLDPSRGKPYHKPVDDIGQRATGSLLAGWLLSLL